MIYFADTYALIEIEKGSPAYKKYSSDKIVTSKLNLMELYYSLIKDYKEERAEKTFELLKSRCLKITDGMIKAAMRFKLAQRKKSKSISYIDCIGYALVLKGNLPFLTGDKEFKDLLNVEFVR